MLYEHHAREGRFSIAWNRAVAWGAGGEAKWICTHNGLTLARGARPDLDVAAIRLPATLADWRSRRD